MLGRAVDFVIEWDWTALYAVFVWAAVLLAVTWTISMKDDPANFGLPEWNLRLRRTGILLMVGGFLISVLFGGSQGWTPWPPMVLIVFGFDFYLATALLTGWQRTRLRAHISAFNRIGFSKPHHPIGT